MTISTTVSSPVLKPADEAGKFLGLLGQGLRRGGRLFDHRGVLLGHLVHLVDGGVDLLQAVGLLLGAWQRYSVTMLLISATCATMRASALPVSPTSSTPRSTCRSRPRSAP